MIDTMAQWHTDPMCSGCGCCCFFKLFFKRSSSTCRVQTFGQAWVEGERMEGSNQLDCDFLPKGSDGSTQKANGLRRTCIGTLPNTLIFHLKRK